jgi:hypothetical protein
MGPAFRPLVALVFAAQTAAAPPLAWSVTDEGPLLGAPHWWHPADTDKDGSLVAARLAGATHGVADTRALAYTNVSRKADATYLADVAVMTVALYNRAAGPLLVVEDGPIVVGSVHRLVLWAAETLHSPALPAQAIAFADTWAEACDAAVGGDVVVLVGCDFGYDGLWLWLKPANAAGVPPAHLAALARASSLVLLRATDGDTYLGSYACPAAAAGGVAVPLYVHSSLASCAADPSAFPRAAALYTAAIPLPPLPPGINGSSLGQWEWGLPDVTVAAYEAVWASLGKRAAAAVRAEGGVVPGYLATPSLWSAYLGANGRAPRGLSLYSYWTAQPALDRADATLPLPSYAFYHPGFTPLVDAANSTLAALVSVRGNGGGGCTVSLITPCIAHPPRSRWACALSQPTRGPT